MMNYPHIKKLLAESGVHLDAKPRGLTEWQKTPAGSKKREDIPSKVFLGENKTYPVMSWDASKGEYVYREQMLRAAISRANSQNRPDISKRASALLKKHFGGDD